MTGGGHRTHRGFEVHGTHATQGWQSQAVPCALYGGYLRHEQTAVGFQHRGRGFGTTAKSLRSAMPSQSPQTSAGGGGGGDLGFQIFKTPGGHTRFDW